MQQVNTVANFDYNIKINQLLLIQATGAQTTFI